MTSNNVALYLSGSNDGSDVSTDVQRQELTSLARDRGFIITAEYVDSGPPAKMENRPDFQRLVRELANGNHPWSKILVIDVSRIAKQNFHAQAFAHECHKRGVDVIFSKMSENDTVTSVILQALFEALDDIHSLMSGHKGLSGTKV